MDPIKSVFVLSHIRLSNRKIGKFKVRTLILVLFIIILLSFLVNLISQKSAFEIFLSLVYLSIVLFLLTYWIISWTEANRLLKGAESLELTYAKHYRVE